MAEEYTSNSNRSKEIAKESSEPVYEKRVTKAIEGNASTRKKSNASKVKDVFISEDVANIKNYVVMDVLVPAVKKAISDIVKNSIEMLLYGSAGDPSKKTRTGGVSYRDYYDSREPRRVESRLRVGYDPNDIILGTRAEAEEVLDVLDGILDQYRVVRVADLYDAVGLSCNYTDSRYGWTNLRNASIERVRDGYVIRMPKAIPID